MRTCVKVDKPVEDIPREVFDWLLLVGMTPTGVAKCNGLLEGKRCEWCSVLCDAVMLISAFCSSQERGER